MGELNGGDQQKISRRRALGAMTAGGLVLAGGLASELYRRSENEIRIQRQVWERYKELPIAAMLAPSSMRRFDTEWFDTDKYELAKILGYSIPDNHGTARLNDGLVLSSGEYPGMRFVRDGWARYLATEANQRELQSVVAGKVPLEPLVAANGLVEANGRTGLQLAGRNIDKVNIFADSNGEWMGNYGCVGMVVQKLLTAAGYSTEVRGAEIPSTNIVTHLDYLRSRSSVDFDSSLSVLLIDPQTDLLGDMEVFTRLTYAQMKARKVLSNEQMPEVEISRNARMRLFRESAAGAGILNGIYNLARDKEVDILKQLQTADYQNLFAAHNYLLKQWVSDTGGMVVVLPFADLHPDSADKFKVKVIEPLKNTVVNAGGLMIDATSAAGSADFDIYQHPTQNVSFSVANKIVSSLGVFPDSRTENAVRADMGNRREKNASFWRQQLSAVGK